jgi:hypothetical protein
MSLRFDPAKICQKLRCKEMLIHVDAPERAEADERLLDPYDAVAYWCECTQTGRGPDGERVHMDFCSLGTDRRCFVGIDDLV